MVVVPTLTVATLPDDEPMVTTAVLLLLHEPPLFSSVVVLPIQIVLSPVITPGSGFTVMACVAVQEPPIL